MCVINIFQPDVSQLLWFHISCRLFSQRFLLWASSQTIITAQAQCQWHPIADQLNVGQLRQHFLATPKDSFAIIIVDKCWNCHLRQRKYRETLSERGNVFTVWRSFPFRGQQESTIFLSCDDCKMLKFYRHISIITILFINLSRNKSFRCSLAVTSYF